MLPRGLTVVIPAYNRPDSLIRAVQSVATSNIDQAEIIVVDDASSEDLSRVLPGRNAFGVAVRTFRLQRNSGPQAARNLGIRRARFSHVAFLDSDDAFHPEKVDVVIEELNRGDCDVLIHAVGGMEKYRSIAKYWLVRRRFSMGWLLAMMNPVPTPGLVVRRVRRLGVPSMRYCEDYAFLIRYVDAATRVRFLDRELSVVHRLQGEQGGLSAAAWKMRAGEFAARRLFLRTVSISAFAKYLIGSLLGVLKVLNDLLRRRYAPSMLFRRQSVRA